MSNSLLSASFNEEKKNYSVCIRALSKSSTWHEKEFKIEPFLIFNLYKLVNLQGETLKTKLNSVLFSEGGSWYSVEACELFVVVVNL